MFKPLRISLSVLSSLSLFVFFIQCKKEPVNLAPDPSLQQKKDSVIAAKKDSAARAEKEREKITYSAFIFPPKKKDSAMGVFKEKYSAEEQKIILALNRLDEANAWRADTLAVPDKFDSSLMKYSPFPAELPFLADVHKIAVFSYPVQAFALYEQGKLMRWGPTSLGKKSAQTKRGLMFANWKKELAISTVDSDWKLPYNFNIHNTLGIGWHEYDLPGFPASHSCLRLLKSDAQFLYNWADQWTLKDNGNTVAANGTPVIVFGDWNWGGKKPWKKLVENSEATNISVAELEAVIAPDLPKILEEQAKTDRLKNQRSAETSSSAA